ncbi:MAG: C-GCAxxG-C-C family (seleno)protein [Deltaproteobacteria bacterium]
MNNEKIINQIKQRARKNFSLGFNCAECVFEAVINTVETGLPKETLKVITGFGGGCGLYGDTCGALAGAIAAVGAVHGRTKLPLGDDPKEIANQAGVELYGKPGLYRLFNQIPNRFRNDFGATLCRELTEKWQNDWLCREHALTCREFITNSAGMAAEFIFADTNTTCSLPFAKNVENIKEDDECREKG